MTQSATVSGRTSAASPADRSGTATSTTKSLKIWLDGQLVDRADAKISVYDHGLLYGDGVFEGIRVYAGKVFEGPAHLRRLYDSAKAIRLEIPIPQEKMMAAIEQTYKANNFTE